MKNTIKKLKLKTLFREEDSRFILISGLKFALISVTCLLFIYYITWIIITLNNVLFEAKGFSSGPSFKDGFMDNALALVYDKLPYLLCFFIFNFFSGIYVAKVLIRPFEIIGHYCREKMIGNNIDYNPDLFSDYRLLTRFSEFFFRYIDESVKRGELRPNIIPENFAKIRTPRFEKVFFFHFLLYISIIAISTTIMAVQLTSTIQEQIVDLSIKVLNKDKSSVAYFLNHQTEVFDSVIVVSVCLFIVSYLLLGLHLYGKVAGAIFGFFATMRSFMRGNYSARVHLVGYAQIRPQSRSLNKYLDQVERECIKNKNEVKSSSI